MKSTLSGWSQAVDQVIGPQSTCPHTCCLASPQGRLPGSGEFSSSSGIASSLLWNVGTTAREGQGQPVWPGSQGVSEPRGRGPHTGSRTEVPSPEERRWASERPLSFGCQREGLVGRALALMYLFIWGQALMCSVPQFPLCTACSLRSPPSQSP